MKNLLRLLQPRKRVPSPPDVVTELCRLLEAHGLACTVQDEWVLPDGRLPAIRGCWYPRENAGRLDVQVLLDGGVLIEECFAGMGSDGKAFGDALHNFMINSLHVLLAALWDVNDPQQVTTERWTVGDKVFVAHIGNFGRRVASGATADVPETLFPALESAIRNEALTGSMHWFRIFFANLDGHHTFEALLDNDSWANGLTCLKSIPWLAKDGYYSVRNFTLLRAA